ncbi:hypothetical protein ACFQ1I_05140 [Kitasatospora arboriphila]
MDINAVLADILDRGAASTEWEALLAAVADHGVYVPVAESGKVLFRRSEDDVPYLPGYVGAACLAEQVAEPRRRSTATRCDCGTSPSGRASPCWCCTPTGAAPACRSGWWPGCSTSAGGGAGRARRCG